MRHRSRTPLILNMNLVRYVLRSVLTYSMKSKLGLVERAFAIGSLDIHIGVRSFVRATLRSAATNEDMFSENVRESCHRAGRSSFVGLSHCEKNKDLMLQG